MTYVVESDKEIIGYRKLRATYEMSKFDALSPEWRAMVRETNIFPFDGETMSKYEARVADRNEIVSV